MAEKIILEWDRERLIAATGTSKAESVRINTALAIDRVGGDLTAEETGELLKTALADRGIAATEAIAVLPRQLVTFHRLTMPNLPEDELLDMVRLQAATRLTAPVESVCLDFWPLPTAPGDQSRDVLLVTVPQEHVADIRRALAVCDISLTSVRVSSFGIAAGADRAGLLSRTQDDTAVEALLALGTDHIEMILMRGRHLVFSFSGASWTSPDGIEQATRAAVSRARMAAAEDLGDYKVSRLTIVGTESVLSHVPDSITKRLNDAPVERVQPHGKLVTGDVPEELAETDLLPVVGSLAEASGATLPSVDLINPRKMAEKPDYSRLIRIAVIGGIALSLTGLWSWRTSQVRKIETETTRLKSDISKMKEDLKEGKTDLQLNTRLTGWTDRDFNWATEMMRLSQLMEGTERIFIRSIKANSNGKKDKLGTIDIVGYAKDRRDIEDFSRVLNEAGYEVSPTNMPLNPRDPAYKYEMVLEVIIPVPEPRVTAGKA